MSMGQRGILFLNLFLFSCMVLGQTPVWSQVPTITITPVATVEVIVKPSASVRFITNDSAPLHWLVNDIEGGKPEIGKIADGTYTAPTSDSDTTSVTVTVILEDGRRASAVVVMGRIRILLADHPSARLSSYPVVPGKPTRFTAKAPDGQEIPLTWTINGDQKGIPATTGQLDINGNIVTYTEPTGSTIAPLELKATPPLGIGYAPATLNLVVTPTVLIRCSRRDGDLNPPPESAPVCKVKDFDRLAGTTGKLPARPRQKGMSVNEGTDLNDVMAINSAKTLFSGSVIEVPLTGNAISNCANYDWKIAVQSEESTGILIYNPSDVGSGICDTDKGQFIIALPVHVLWADVFGYRQNLDPARAAPAKPSNPPSFTDCLGKSAPKTIAPCDKNTSWVLTQLYKIGPLYNHFTPPGNGQGSINFSGKGEVNFDIQADPAYKVGVGWINVPIVFERGPTNANLNSLIFAAAYDFRWLKNPNFGELTAKSVVIFRKPQVQIRSGIEVSPSHPGAGMAPGQSHDWNYIWGETVRFPVAVNFHDQPSSFTFYPVIGGEQGLHLASNLPQNSPIVRGVAGADASFRWPFNTTHNFFGSTPIGFEVQYRMRALAYQEPFADFAGLPPSSAAPPCPDKLGIAASSSGKGCVATEILSSIPRSFFKADMTVPLDPYIQFKVSASRGSLPPDFWNIGWTYTLGLSFGNPASSEH